MLTAATGQTNGLKGEAIHIFGRIVMIVDIFDVLTSDRPYKAAYSVEKALEMMREEKGRFFDPALLYSFIEIRSSFSDIYENCTNPFEELLKYEQTIP